MHASPSLPSLADQAERLIALGIADIAGVGADELRSDDSAGAPDALLVIHQDRLPASALAPMIRRNGRAGFVVSDMVDVDKFTPIPEITVPSADVYVVADLDRGDQMTDWTPDQALPALLAAGRTPLTLAEGIHWVLQLPDALERNHCFMTIGSRRRQDTGRLDARTPAIWLSNGTGRDGAAHRDAPKVGWCWAGNRHTWLGFASATGRRSLQPAG